MFVCQRPSSDLVVSLRATLEELAENFRSAEDQPIMAELRRLLMLHIADLDDAEAPQEEENAQ